MREKCSNIFTPDCIIGTIAINYDDLIVIMIHWVVKAKLQLLLVLFMDGPFLLISVSAVPLPEAEIIKQ